MLTITSGFELEVERGPDLLVVRLRNVDSPLTEESALCERLWSLLKQHFTYRLVLELDELEVLNSAFIGELLELCRRIEQHGGVLRICGLSPENVAVLRACRLAERLPPYEDRKAAIMGRYHPDKPR